MQKGFIYTHFKKATCCLIFLFSFLVSFSSVNNNHHVYVQINNQTSIDTDQLDYDEFSITSIGHLTESPENPAEGESNSGIENEKENENETDDEKDELIGHLNLVEIVFDVFSQKESYLHKSEFLSHGAFVPFYILFHSWKSFLA